MVVQAKLLERDFRVPVLGLEQLGRYHAEGAARFAGCGEIWGLDVSQSASRAFEALEESLSLETKTPFRVATSVSSAPRPIRLLIVATTADARGSAMAGFLGSTHPDFVLLEKPVSSSRASLETLREVCPNGAYVNFPRRYCALHLEAIRRATAFNKSQIRITIQLPTPTLLSHSSHMMDFAGELTGEAPEKVTLNPNKVSPVKSKRKGFMDLQGQMSVSYACGAKLMIEAGGQANKAAATGVRISIQSGSSFLLVDESESTISESGGGL